MSSRDAPRRRLPWILASTGVALASLSSGVALYASVRTAAISSDMTEALARQGKKLDRLSEGLAELRGSCAAAHSAFARIQSRTASPQAPQAPAAALPIDEIATAVSDRLAARDESSAPPRDAVSVQASDDAARILDGVIQRKRWTDRDALALQAMSERVHPEDLFELKRRLSVAVNAGEVVLESREGF